jgi:hypothetical protein
VSKAIEINKTLRAMDEAGVSAVYHCCDVSDRTALGETLDQIRKTASPIEGIIHGAGVELSGRFERKTPAQVDATIAAKADGAAALLALTREDPIRHFVAFGSVIGRFGGLGQTDYALASDLLNKLIHQYRGERASCASVSILWPAWDEVGMSVRPETKLTLTVAGVRFMPPAEGIEHAIQEIEAGAPEGEVLIMDQARGLDVDGIMPAPGDWEAQERAAERCTGLALTAGINELKEDRQLVVEVRLDPSADPFLTDHRLHDRPILPAAMGLEALAEAASLLACTRTVVALKDVEIVNGLRFHSDRSETVRTRARTKEDTVECELVGDFFNRRGRLIEPDRLYVKGTVEVADRPCYALEETLIPPPDGWYPMPYPEASQGAARFFYHGPTMRCLREVCLVPGGGYGRILAPDPAGLGGSRTAGWVIPVAVLDACLVGCAAYSSQVHGIIPVPHAFGRVQLGRLPHVGEACILRVDYRGVEKDRTMFDFTLVGSNHEIIIAVTRYQCIPISSGRAF